MIVWIPLVALAVIILYRRKIVQEWTYFRTERKAWLLDKWKNWGEPFVVAAILAIVIRTFLLGPYKIPTGSMRPTFLEGDRIFVDKISYRFKEPRRGDIIVFKYPLDEKKDFVKRLVGLPGDKIEIKEGKLIINDKVMEEAPFSENYYYNVPEASHGETRYGAEGQVVVVPEKSLFALGDNSAHSSDGRNWGFVPEENLVGRAFIIWWPPNRVKMAD